MNTSWRDQAIVLCDQAWRRGERISLAQLAKAVGKNRSTLWRDEKIRALVTTSKNSVDRLAAGGPLPVRRTVKQQWLELKMDNEKLKKDNERLLINFVVVCRRLQERGIDPRSVLGELTPEIGKCEWKQAILPWRDL